MSTKSRNYHYSFSEGSVIISLLCSLTLWGCAVQEKIASSPDNQIPSNTQENVILIQIPLVSLISMHIMQKPTRRGNYLILFFLISMKMENFMHLILSAPKTFSVSKQKNISAMQMRMGNGSASLNMILPIHLRGNGLHKEGRLLWFINTDGEEVIPVNYLDAAPFSDGLAYFCTQTGYGFMDHEGKPVFYLDCDSVSSFHGGLAYFSIDGKYGYIDQTER